VAAEWWYIGHYGELGPLTLEQIDELIEGGVIQRDTYIWRTGLPEWTPADRVDALGPSFRKIAPFAAPPPPPGARPPTHMPGPMTPGQMSPGQMSPNPMAPAPLHQGHVPAGYNHGRPPYETTPAQVNNYMPFPSVRSDKSRTLGGILQLLIPGVGRIYLGYAAIGVLQLVLSLCGVGAVWSWIDGIVILAGGVRIDGYGRQLND